MLDIIARHWIDGSEAGEPTVDSLDPATGERVGRFADGDEATAHAAIAAARTAFDRSDWAASPWLRRTILLHWAAVMESRKEELAQLLIRENGKAIAETGGYRQSGLDRLHGCHALADFTELKHIYQAPGVLAV